MRMLLLAASAAFFLSASPASAQTSCGDLATVLTQLNDRYGELPVGKGEDYRGGEIVVLANPDTGTFTVLYVMEGRACLMGGGEKWQRYQRPSI